MIFEVETSDAPVLVHYGVKGMRWGERRAHRKAMKALNKASVAKDKAEFNRQVDAARARVAGGKTDRAYASAKAKYKHDKNVIGKREAKKALHAAREKRHNDIMMAQQTKFGRETTHAMLGIGILAVTVGGLRAAQLAR